jgi:hypothetical protein
VAVVASIATQIPGRVTWGPLGPMFVWAEAKETKEAKETETETKAVKVREGPHLSERDPTSAFCLLRYSNLSVLIALGAPEPTLFYICQPLDLSNKGHCGRLIAFIQLFNDRGVYTAW